jgi:hypothetical protein
MRHGREPRQPRTAKQLDLFGIPGSCSAGLALGWEALPPHARAELTTLMIRLILEHAHGHGATAVKAARHEH